MKSLFLPLVIIFWVFLLIFLALDLSGFSEAMCRTFCRHRRALRKIDPCTDAALASCRRSGLLKRFWCRYCQVTGCDKPKRQSLVAPWMKELNKIKEAGK